MNPTIAKLLNADAEQRREILSSLKPGELASVFKELEEIEKAPRRRWYCNKIVCDGRPHAGFHWCEHPVDSENHVAWCNHARTPQRPPKEDPMNPWLVWFFSGGRGTGKALALDTPIPTPFGWSKMGELKVGDVVFDEQGRMCNITAVFDTMPERAYRLTFSDGSEIVACDEHQWVTLTAQERKQLNRKGLPIPDNWANKQSVTTNDIVDTLTYGRRADTNHSIPVSKPLELPNIDLPIDPYILGVWLGDGSSASGQVTCHDDDVSHYQKRFAEAGETFEFASRRHEDKPTGTYSIGKRPPERNALGQMTANGSIHSKLREANLLHAKHIPVEYLRGSVAQRTALLQGLMDTDGYIDARGLAEFTSTNRLLAEGVVELARSLGQKPILKTGRATLYGKDCGEKYRVTWRPTVDVVSLPRKAKRLKPYGAQGMRNHHRMIVGFTEIPIQPMRCITVDSQNSMYLAGEGMVPTHNTRAGAEWVLDLVWNQGYKRIALVGRTPADVRDVMIYGDSGIMSVSDPHPRPTHEPTKRRLVWPNGAQAFTYSAAAPSQLRGPQHDAAWCVAKGELVTTCRGEIPIEQVKVGDFVATRNGYRRVLATMMTNPDAEIMEIYDNEGRVLRCTPNHRVFANGDWQLAENVSPSDVLKVIGSAETKTSVSAVLRNGQRGAVYDLSIEGEHEFFASGILVHNCDELAAWTDAPKGDVLDTSWNNLMLGLRLPGHNPKALVTTTPKRVKLVRQVMERRSTVITTGTTYENLHNMAAAFKEQVLTAYEGTRIGRQELDGVLLTDVEGALWTLEMIDDARGRFAIPKMRGMDDD